MRKLFNLFFVLFLISCHNQTKNSTEKNDYLISADQSIADTTNSNEDSDECMFDQKTQTDEFLSKIPELSGYKWDYDSRTATFKFKNGDSLFLTRGGCDHFGVSVEFRIRNDTANYKNWTGVYDKILWIAKLLKKEFEYDLIKNEIDSNKVKIISVEQGEAVYFSGEYLQDNHYSIVRRLDKDLKVIILSYYIN